MLRKLIVVLMSLTLCWTTVACGSSSSTSYQTPAPRVSQARSQTRLTQGQYPVQQAQYDDGSGEYSLMLLNTPPGTPPVYRTSDLQMARLTDEQVEAGKSSYLEVNNNNQGIFYLTEDFKIECVHNVTETRTDPATGQQQVVVVRQESSFWRPFAGAFIGSAIASTLFAPRYYVPPIYQPGGTLMGYGGYGNTYQSAVNSYSSRYNSPPPAVTNRQTLRTTGTVRSTNRNRTTNSPTTGTSRSTGSGVGSSNLQRSNPNRSGSTQKRTPSFGSGGTRRSSPARRSFGSRRRR